jgi:hypothetical protein
VPRVSTAGEDGVFRLRVEAVDVGDGGVKNGEDVCVGETSDLVSSTSFSADSDEETERFDDFGAFFCVALVLAAFFFVVGDTAIFFLGLDRRERVDRRGMV